MGTDRGVRDYFMTRHSSFKDPLTRILEEAVLIKRQEGDSRILSLNTRAEYFGSQMTSVVIRRGIEGR